MNFRKSLLAGLCVAALGGITVPMAASAEVGIYFNVAPPEARYEAVPDRRDGYVWSSGYWNANENRHEWEAGHWERNREGYQFAQPAWTRQDNRWQLQRGHWNGGEDQK